jgi:acyl carrier protein
MTAYANSIVELFRNQLSVEVQDLDADLIADGLMDSFMLVDLIMFLEQEHDITIDFDGLEVDNFRSITSITRFVEARKSA